MLRDQVKLTVCSIDVVIEVGCEVKIFIVEYYLLYYFGVVAGGGVFMNYFKMMHHHNKSYHILLPISHTIALCIAVLRHIH